MTFQLGTSLLDACVLAVLSRGDAYGYSLTQRVRKAIDISESTLYPVLRRLQKDGCLTTYDKAFQGRNRRYYAITTSGTQRCTQLLDAWNDYKKNIDCVLYGGEYDDQNEIS
mgnify:CR=1 FL=1